MKYSSFLLLAGASVALASPIVDVVYETEVSYYTVTEEVTTVETVPAGAPGAPGAPNNNVNVVAATTSSSSAPVVTVTVGATEAASTTQSSTTSSAIQVTSSAVVEAASSASPTDFAGTATYHHNIHRSNNSAPSMTYDDTYASYASTVAASCTFAHNL